MAHKLITPASTLAVSLVEAKAHLRVDSSDDDTLITAMITVATETAEQIMDRAVMPQTWELTLDAFPPAFELRTIPVASVTSIKYYDDNGAQTTLDPSYYTLDNASDFRSGYVVPAYGEAWPSTRNQINAVAARYVSGYANAAAVPEPIKAWIKLQVGAMYENRESDSALQPKALNFAYALLDRYKVYA